MPTELVITLETGDVTIQLLPDLAPKHVERIVQLASEGFYDGVAFGRVSPNFIFQTTPDRSPLPDLEAEFSAVRHDRGVCSMARGVEPDSANSGFFIMAASAAFMNCQYTIWGQVTAGMEHLDALPIGEPPAKPGVIVATLVK